MIMRWVHRALDWADRHGGWMPPAGGALTGAGLAWIALIPGGPGWTWGAGMLAGGLVVTAIRPCGTQLRRRLLIRQLHRMLDSDIRRSAP